MGSPLYWCRFPPPAAEYDNPLNFNIRGCWSGVVTAIRDLNKDFTPRFHSEIDRALLDAILPEEDVHGTYNLATRINIDTDTMPATDPWYECKHERWLTDTVEDPKDKTR